MNFFYFFLCFFVIIRNNCEAFEFFQKIKLGIEPGPKVRATKGEVWPKPQSQISSKVFFVVRPNSFDFQNVGHTCEILEKAFQRYKQDLKHFDRIRRTIRSYREDRPQGLPVTDDENCRGFLDQLSINLRAPCENMPYMNMDEHYELRINTDDVPDSGILVAQSVWGILRGLETFSQLLHTSNDCDALIINGTSIMDFPRFSHRGLLIDTSRHFLPLRIIYIMLDAMAMCKLNVLHWHIVDDQSFPFVSQKFPKLSSEGAYAQTHIYTPSNVQSVIKYAAYRGIRVIPEFDTPGHTRSWGEGYPQLLTACYDNKLNFDGSLGPMNPIRPGTYDFMEEFLKEIKETFPDSYIHLGGDEVNFECWESNPDILSYMVDRKMNAKELEGIYIQRIIEMTSKLPAESIVWQEVFDDGVNLPNETLVHIWKHNYRSELDQVTKKGYKTLLSSCWYLDSVNSGGDWEQYYYCDPHAFYGSDDQKRLVLGGEACMWGEVVDVNNVISRVWPRACATAEKLWSAKTVTNITDAAMRLEEHTCRMNRRKIPAQPPNGPGFCPEANFM